ncbi:rhomboid family intramembrane serine protease [Burkholderia sp. 22PA0099]|uniref:rhomboid family intramembrane serine protease n=1 Tax=Burkholderia sp. 22PA0099 TaxID=3237372 RepID=UPI0039C40EC8
MNDIASTPGMPPHAPAVPPATHAAHATATPADTCRIRFSVQPRPHDSLRRPRHEGFPGRGTLSFEANGAGLSLDGQSGGLFNTAPFHLAIPRAQIFDASSAGKRVFFDLHTPDGVLSVVLLAADADSAAWIAGRLPMQVTSAFSTELDAHARYADRMHAQPVAWATWGLIALNLLLYAAMVASGVSPLKPEVPAMIAWGANYGPDTLDGDWWRLLTGAFEHFGAVHLAVNMLVLARFGPLAERLYGSQRFVALYLFAGVFASMTSVTWDAMQCSAGASGAILGVFGAVLAYLLRRRRELPALVHDHQRALALGFVAYCLYNGFTHPMIDNAAHLGGLVAGFAVGLALAPPLDTTTREATAGAQVSLAAGVGALMAIALAYPLAHPGHERVLELRFAREYMATTNASAEIGTALVALQHEPMGSDAERLAVSNRVMTDIVPRWNNLYAALSSVPLPDGSPYRALRDTSLGMLDNARRMASTYALMLVRSPLERDAMVEPYRALLLDQHARRKDLLTEELALHHPGRGAQRPAAPAAGSSGAAVRS